MSRVALNHKQPVNQAVKRRREAFLSALLSRDRGKWITLLPSQRQVLPQGPFCEWQCAYSGGHRSLGLFLWRFKFKSGLHKEWSE